jgi:large subunit ribosomal protein L21
VFRRLLEEGSFVYAIVRAGGRQYRVEKGDTIYVDRLETPVGETVRLGEVLLLAGEGEARVGNPLLSATAVVGTVVDQVRDKKIRVFKYKKRKHYRRTRGHRQALTALRIDAIEF